MPDETIENENNFAFGASLGDEVQLDDPTDLVVSLGPHLLDDSLRVTTAIKTLKGAASKTSTRWPWSDLTSVEELQVELAIAYRLIAVMLAPAGEAGRYISSDDAKLVLGHQPIDMEITMKWESPGRPIPFLEISATPDLPY